jgi:hypothetical protein
VSSFSYFRHFTDFTLQSQASREYDLLKTQLLQGGLSVEALESLTAGADNVETHQDESDLDHSWADEVAEAPYTHRYSDRYQPRSRLSSDYAKGPRNCASTTGQNSIHHTSHTNTQPHLRTPTSHRNTSKIAPPSYLPDDGFGDSDSLLLDDESPTEVFGIGGHNDSTQRTLYFTGFPPRTTYQDLISTIRGGKLLSITLRSEKSATVTFLNAAADYLTWAKRNDLYIHSKRVCLL